jgi:lysozyme family protein
MADFLPALAFVLDSEDPKRQYAVVKDNNGADCISGINAQYYARDVAEIAALPQESRGPAVATFYYRRYWAATRWFQAFTSQSIASKLMDMAVNMGLREAFTLAQRAVNHYRIPNVRVDGELGPTTVQAYNGSPDDVAMASLAVECEQFYRDVVKHKPEYEKYLKGWLARAHRVPKNEVPSSTPAAS